MKHEIALFPLNVVLFPAMRLPIYVFEERYKLMIADCLEEDLPFGVVLIKSGREVGGAGEAYSVGTLARIIEVQRQPDGRMHLTVIGERRFRILEITQQSPYIVAKVRFLSERQGYIQGHSHTHLAMANRVAALFLRYLELVMAAPSSPKGVPLPSDPQHLSYLVASTMEIPLAEKQRLLEMFSIEELLEEEAVLLQRELSRKERDHLLLHVLDEVSKRSPTSPEQAVWN